MTAGFFVGYRIENALDQPGCPVCSEALRYERRYLDTLLYEYVTDPPTNLRFREGRGLCSYHAAAVLQANDPLGVAILHEGLLAYIIELLGPGAEGTERDGGLISRLMAFIRGKRGRTRPWPRQPCMVCRARQDWEDLTLQVTCEALNHPDFQSLYAQSEGLCLPHQKFKLDHLQLQNYIELQSYQHQGEPLGEAKGAWIRAVQKASGRLRSR